jgi:hypothetical protein
MVSIMKRELRGPYEAPEFNGGNKVNIRWNRSRGLSWRDQRMGIIAKIAFAEETGDELILQRQGQRLIKQMRVRSSSVLTLFMVVFRRQFHLGLICQFPLFLHL